MVRIMSYNIRKGGEARLSLLSTMMHAQSPDLIAVLEANDDERITKIAARLHMQVAFGVANSPYHIAWLSRLPIHHFINHRHPIFRKTLLEIQVVWEGHILHAFALHLAAGRDIAGELHRLREIHQALAIIANVPQDHVLLVGDLNAIHPDDMVAIPSGGDPAIISKAQRIAQAPRLVLPAILEAGLVDGFRHTHPTATGFTYTTTAPMARFDYAFATPSMVQRARRCSVITSRDAILASDHFPLVVELQ